MRTLGMAVLAFAVAWATSTGAFACGGRGGGGSSCARSGGAKLTGPSSYHVNAMMQEKMRQAYLQQLQVRAAQHAADQEKRAAMAAQRRAELLERRERSRERNLVKHQR